MNILETLLNAQRVQQAGQQLGLGTSETQAVLRQLAPALTGGLKRNLDAAGGLEALTRALSGGKHQAYLDDPAALQSPNAVTDGNAILGHLFGNKDVSRSVASQAAGQTGIDASTIKKFLPLAAAAVMGALSKQSNAGASLTSSGGGATDLLRGLIDSDGNGIGLDDLLKLGKKIF